MSEQFLDRANVVAVFEASLLEMGAPTSTGSGATSSSTCHTFRHSFATEVTAFLTGFFGAVAVMASAQGVANTIEQLGLRRA